MPRDLSGNYTLPVGNPVVNATVISPAWGNTTLSDIALQLNNVLTGDGLLAATAPIRFVAGLVGAPGISFAASPSTGLWAPNTGSLAISSAGVERARFDSARTDTPIVLTGGVQLTGDPLSFSATVGFGPAAVGWLSAYLNPTMPVNSTGSSQIARGLLINSTASATSTGTTSHYAVQSVGTSGPYPAGTAGALLGTYSLSTRENAADFAAGSVFNQWAGYFQAQTLNTLPTTANNNIMTGVVGQILARGGAGALTATGVQSVLILNAQAGSVLTMAFPNAIGLSGQAQIGVVGATTTVTNLYGLRLLAPTIAGTTTITNRYGVSSEDASAINYFAGGVGIGTLTPASLLHVSSGVGAVLQTWTASGNNFQLENSTGNWFLGSTNAGDLELRTNATMRMKLLAAGGVVQTLLAAAPTLANSELNFALTTNTNLRITCRGTDGTLRTANITLA